MKNSNARRFRHGSRPHHRAQPSPAKKYFDPSHLVQKAVIAPLEVVQIEHQFSDFAIADVLKNNILHKGYQTPTPIQDQIIPHILEGKDVVGLANTGTGKTAAFLIPLIEKVISNNQSKIVIIAPTRELAFQIQEELQGFTYGLPIRSSLCIGGVSIDRQIDKLKKHPHFVIGTPGRIKDLTKRGNLKLRETNAIVLDEVDRMLDMGFLPDVKEIISYLPEQRQSLFFSATLPENLKPVMGSFLKNPVTISVKTQETKDSIDQEVIQVMGKPKIDILENMLQNPAFSKVLVFGSTKWKLNKLERNLRDKGYRVAAIHGNKTQQQRQKALQQFKSNQIQALLATDIASRGIDIEGVTHVINFDMPQTYEDYIHRIGRTGRANQIGKAITLVD